MELDAGSHSPVPGAGWHRLHYPVGVFLIVFGATRVGSLLDWSGRHRDAARMLGVGDGAVTALLGVSAVGELLLTLVAVLAVSRRRDVWLLVALAGWLAEFLVLAVVAGVAGDVPRLAEHGLFLVAFGGLLAATYRWSGATRVSGRPGAPDAVVSAPPQPALATLAAPLGPSVTTAEATPEPRVAPEQAPVRPSSDTTRRDLRAQGRDADREDVGEPAGDPPPRNAGPSRSDVTRRDVAEPTRHAGHRDAGIRESDVTHRDVGAPDDDAARRDVGASEDSEDDAARRDIDASDDDDARRDGAEPPSDATRQDLTVRRGGSAGKKSEGEDPATDDAGATRNDLPVRPRGAEPPAAADAADAADASETLLDRDG
ncbi:hypothetical protein NE236_15965 [Actinoallomurus purpureus]|uniref:hypothetical protein n=1 Tax=Actinoallomurus purpureus TaxID=478114 RepID=UPI002093EB1A|nr:hypothetical protein [Actinoallomurus purpureus]MCO6006482.1 hypothetical protein [Actinoallomurus purpureus]